MRTTLTLDEDVALMLRRLCAQRNERFKKVVNHVLRTGLAALQDTSRPRAHPYRTRPVSLGKPRLPSLDNIAEVLAIAEREDHL